MTCRPPLALVFATIPTWIAAEEPIDQATRDAAAACNYFLNDYLDRNMEGRPDLTLLLIPQNAVIRPLKLNRYSEMTWLGIEWTMGSGIGIGGQSEVFTQHHADITCTSDQADRRVLYIDIVNANPSGPVFTDIPFTFIDVGSLAHAGRY
jgi:hypothetical protein